MGKKGIIIFLGFGLLFVGIVLAVPILANLLSSFVKGYAWTWTFSTFLKVSLGIVAIIIGFVMFFIGMARKGIFWLTLVGIFLLITCVGSFVSYKYVIENSNNQDKEVNISIDKDKGIPFEIPQDANTAQIAELLKGQGIIGYPYIFKILSKINGYDNRYRAGTHIVANNLDYNQLMHILADEPEMRKITFLEGDTYKQIKDKLKRNNLIDGEKFDKAAKKVKFDYKFIEDLPRRENRLEGYLFPDTYNFGVKEGEEEVIKKMLDNFDKKFKPEYYKKAKDLNMSIDQIITLASILEVESAKPDERRIMAGVFYKRIKGKDTNIKKLQSDATINYIFINRGENKKEKLSKADIEMDDPYNTYKYEGLPPGPICSPSLDAIEAALNPAQTEYLYFVARGDGTSEFSKTYNDHLKAMKKYGLLK